MFVSPPASPLSKAVAMLRRVVLVSGLVTAGVSFGNAGGTASIPGVHSGAGARALRQDEPRPKSLEEWRTANTALRENLSRAWGEFPFERGRFRFKSLGTLDRDGYRLERLLLETMPGVWMTGARLCAEAARSGCRRSCRCMATGRGEAGSACPARCISAAKHGFFVLAVDAFVARGAGIEAGPRGVSR